MWRESTPRGAVRDYPVAMDGAWLARARWRSRGAWMWPTFVVLGIADGVLAHALPVAGQTQTVLGGIVLGLFVNLLCIVLLARPVGVLLRRRRRDLPAAIARNYAGTACLVLVTAGFTALGIAHHSTIVSNRSAMRDAVTRASAYIGSRAPAAFRADASRTDTFAIQPGSIYRTCVPNLQATRTYCVIVRDKLPFASSVTPDGYEPNAVFSLGVN